MKRMALLVIVSAVLFGAGLRAEEPAASEPDTIFASDFGDAADADYNGWPDGWTRRKGPGYPHYVKAQIDIEAQDDALDALRIDLNGGAIEVYSPRIPVDELHEYAVSGDVRTAGLVHDQARIAIDFFDQQDRLLGRIASAATGGSNPWTKLQTIAGNVRQQQPAYAVVALVVAPTAQQDLRGTVWFNHVRLLRQPRLMVNSQEPAAVYYDPAEVVVVVKASGLKQRVDQVSLELLDHRDTVVAQESVSLVGSERDARAGGDSQEYQGAAEWRPSVPGFGFYQVRASLANATARGMQQTTPLVVAEKISAGKSRFGWSMPTACAAPGQLISARAVDSGLGWLKLPLWSQENDEERTQTLRELVERASEKNVNCVGILDAPPADIAAKLTDVNLAAAADVFNAPAETWNPSIQALFVSYAMQVRNWQLGADGDTSFVGYPGLLPQLRRIKHELEQSGQVLQLGVGWDWLEQLPAGEGLPLRFVTMTAQPPLLTDELETYLGEARAPGLFRWVAIDPASLEGETLDEQARSLVLRMTIAASAGADAIYFADPLLEERGLIDRNGQPTQLYLPWRTTALLLNGMAHLGELQLPSGSRNRVFARGEQAAMVVWSDKPHKEELYLGDHLTARDIYGRLIPLAADGDKTIVEVGPSPIFVSGLQPNVARWRREVKFTRPQIPSVPGKPLEQELTLVNTFGQTISGRVKLETPGGWVVAPSHFDFRLNANESLTKALKITLPYGAESGPQQVRLACEVYADQPYRFEATRTIQIGLDDVQIEIDTQVGDDGVLEIEQRLTNNSDQPVRLRCSLFARDRHRQQFELFGPAQSQSVATLKIARGGALLGETMWLRAAEVGTGRVFNYRFVVER